jgi:SET and MYND domain-containing protein
MIGGIVNRSTTQVLTSSEVEVEVDRDAVLRYITAVEANGFFITDLDGRKLGNGYYPTAALLNHSCVPNAVVHFNKGRIEVRAMRRIFKGEELFISYTEL